ncbi:uncharacterized protein LOC143918811 [Arctopsyche grandis]|uniref:uncharacterized protein LOC143918811 n=1 Tax=Arctopsyche grandis TaxID=121162 RepID=UPI00406DA31B
MASNIMAVPRMSANSEEFLMSSYDLNDRLLDFVKYFVTEMETTLKLHYDILEGIIKKSGLIPEALEIALGMVATNYICSGTNKVVKLLRKPLRMPFEILKKNKSLEYHEIVYSFQKSKEKGRRLFVDIAIDVFRSFEFQFVDLYSKYGPQEAMKNVAIDAAQRFMNRFKTNPLESYSKNKMVRKFQKSYRKINKKLIARVPPTTIDFKMNAQKVIEGKSKSKSAIIPDIIWKPGYDIQYKCKESHKECENQNNDWNTANLFDEAGVTEKKEGEEDYNVYARDKSNCEKYGYRLRFQDETLDGYYLSEKCKRTCMHPCYLKKTEDFYELQYGKILKKINDSDGVAAQRRIVQLTEEILEHTKENLKQIIDKHHEIGEWHLIAMKAIEHQLMDIIDGQRKVMDQLESAQMDRDIKAEKNQELHQITRETTEKVLAVVEDVNKKIEQNCKVERILFRLKKPVKTFEGRITELKLLHDALIEGKKTTVISQTASIVGLGGIGKTELSSKYVEIFNDYYYNIVFINAEKQETILESIKSLAKKLDIKLITHRKIDDKIDSERIAQAQTQINEKERDMKYVIEDIYSYFDKSGNTLVIFDNVDDYKAIKNYLFNGFSKNNFIYTLITSRCQNWNIGLKGDIAVIRLDGFTMEEAVEYLNKSLIDESEDDVRTLASVLERFPLALRQAVGYIQQQSQKENWKRKPKDFKIINYLDLYKEQRMILLKEGHEEDDDVYNQTIATTWRITLNKIEECGQCGKLALSIMKIMSYLAADNIDVENIFLKLEKDEDILYNAVGLLNNYSMIDLERGIVNVHRLVQEAIKIHLIEINEEETILRQAIKLLEESNSIEHVVNVWEHSSKYPKILTELHDSSTYGYWNDTPIHLLASHRNDTIAIAKILQHVKCIDSKDRFNDTILNKASINGNLNVVKFLTDHNANVSSKNLANVTPLHSAAMNGHVEIVKILISKDKTLTSKQSILNMSPIDLAVYNGHSEIVEILIQQFHSGKDEALRWHARFNDAVRKEDIDKCKDIIRSLEETDPALLKSMIAESKALHVATADCGIEMIDYLLRCGLNINSHDNLGNTPIFKSLRNSRFEVPKHLLEMGADPNVRNKDESTPLQWASVAGNLPIMQLLIDNRADINMADKNGYTPLFCAAGTDNFKAFNLLLDRGADLNSTNKDRHTVLHYAAKYDAIDEMDRILKHGEDPNVRDKNGCTPLHWAAQNGSIKVIQLLLDNGAKFGILNNGGETPLLCAARNSKFKAMNLLLDRGADLKSTDRDGSAILHYIATYGADEEVDRLLKKGADPNVQNIHGSTPLHWGAVIGSLRIVQLLLDKGADVNIPDICSDTPLLCAARNNHSKVVKLLLERGADPKSINEDGNSVFHYTATYDAVEEIDQLLKKGANLNARNNDESTPLHWAAENGSLRVMQKLLEKKADIDVTAKDGATPLICAAQNNKFNAMNLLLKRGADPKITNDKGNSILHYIAKYDAVEELKRLLEKGEDPNVSNVYKSRPLHWAADEGSLNVMQLLLDKEGDVDVCDESGDTPLFRAAKCGRFEAIKRLLNNGANSKFVSKSGRNLLLAAAYRCDVDTIKFIIQLGFDLTAVDEIGNSMLHIAVRGENEPIIKFLVAAGIDPNITNKVGWTALHDIADNQKHISKEIIKLLIHLGASPNPVDQINRTPLHLASNINNYKAVTVLIEECAEINVRDKFGQSALHLAAAKFHLQIITFLLQNGAEVNMVDGKSRPPLYHLSRRGKMDAVKLLLQNGADSRKLDGAGHSLLHLAILHLRYRAVDYIIRGVDNIDVNAQTIDGKTPLHLAAKCGRATIVCLLIHQGADTSATDKYGNSPLDYAMKFNRAAVTNILLKVNTGKTTDI